jgi:hypothetical protein
MPNQRHVKAGLILALATGVAAATASAAPRVVWCDGAQLKASFTVVRGSAGAGNIVYRLVVTNVSGASCRLTGLPKVTLLRKNKAKQPTHVIAAHPNMLTSVLVTLKRGASAKADARFSPDVPGPGEGKPGAPCDPRSYWLRVSAPGGGSTLAPIKPPTPVCEHGQLQFDAYSPT